MAAPLAWLSLSILPLLPARLSSNAFPLLTAPGSQLPGNNEPLCSRLVTGTLAVQRVCPDGPLGRVAGRQQRCRLLRHITTPATSRQLLWTPFNPVLI